MDKTMVLQQLINRKRVIENRGKESAGVLRKLDRQIRNLQAEIKKGA